MTITSRENPDNTLTLLDRLSFVLRMSERRGLGFESKSMHLILDKPVQFEVSPEQLLLLIIAGWDLMRIAKKKVAKTLIASQEVCVFKRGMSPSLFVLPLHAGESVNNETSPPQDQGCGFGVTPPQSQQPTRWHNLPRERKGE